MPYKTTNIAGFSISLSYHYLNKRVRRFKQTAGRKIYLEPIPKLRAMSPSGIWNNQSLCDIENSFQTLMMSNKYWFGMSSEIKMDLKTIKYKSYKRYSGMNYERSRTYKAKERSSH